MLAGAAIAGIALEQMTAAGAWPTQILEVLGLAAATAARQLTWRMRDLALGHGAPADAIAPAITATTISVSQ